ncbi:MAG: hypothetical protein AMJ65_15080, partial [Phycisphaerae bacterium SG8_4]
MEANTLFSNALTAIIVIGGCKAGPQTNLAHQEKSVSASVSPRVRVSPAGTLCEAIAGGDIALAKSLIKDGVDVNGRNEV